MRPNLSISNEYVLRPGNDAGTVRNTPDLNSRVEVNFDQELSDLQIGMHHYSFGDQALKAFKGCFGSDIPASNQQMARMYARRASKSSARYEFSDPTIWNGK